MKCDRSLAFVPTRSMPACCVPVMHSNRSSTGCRKETEVAVSGSADRARLHR